MKMRILIACLPLFAVLGGCASTATLASADDKEEVVEVTGSHIPKKVSKASPEVSTLNKAAADDFVERIRNVPATMTPSMK